METKVCCKCKRELPVDNFSFKNKEKGTRHSLCLDCEKQYKRDWYYRHYKEKETREKFLKRNREYMARVNDMINQHKTSCLICGEDNKCCLDFHHLDPNLKEGAIASIKGRVSSEEIQAEINKCVVLCANCHRKVHAGYINLKNYL